MSASPLDEQLAAVERPMSAMLARAEILDRQLEAMRRAANATPAEREALTELAAELGSPPTPCPRCGFPMGDGDRVLYGVCGPCRRAVRR